MAWMLQSLGQLLGIESAPGTPAHRDLYMRSCKLLTDELAKPPAQRDVVWMVEEAKRSMRLMGEYHQVRAHGEPGWAAAPCRCCRCRPATHVPLRLPLLPCYPPPAAALLPMRRCGSRCMPAGRSAGVAARRGGVDATLGRLPRQASQRVLPRLCARPASRGGLLPGQGCPARGLGATEHRAPAGAAGGEASATGAPAALGAAPACWRATRAAAQHRPLRRVPS